MKINLAYIAPESFDYQVENFNNFLEIKLLKSIDELLDVIDKNTVDVLVIDNKMSDNFDDLAKICSNHNSFKTYFLFEEAQNENLVWAVNQPWIDKIIPSSGGGFALTNELITIATEETKMLMENKQLMQDNRELEFVISQMMLVD